MFGLVLKNMHKIINSFAPEQPHENPNHNENEE